MLLSLRSVHNITTETHPKCCAGNEKPDKAQQPVQGHQHDSKEWAWSHHSHSQA